MEISYLDAMNAALAEEMERDERVFVMGEDVEIGIFRMTRGLVDRFGKERIRNTPISEAAVVGAAVGASMLGQRPVVDLNIATFCYVAMDQIVNQVAKNRYLFGGQATMPLVLRMSIFARGNIAAQHADRPYPSFMNVPGLKIVAPSTPYDAKGLLKSAIRDDDPVLYFDESSLWARREHIPNEDYVVPIGQAAVRRQGTDVTLVSIFTLYESLAAADALAREGISVEVIDPRTLVPMDWETILDSVHKTGRLVVADLAHRTCGAAAEISAFVAERAFPSLKAPIVRVTTPDVHIPFSMPLERAVYPTKDSIAEGIRKCLNA